MVGLAQEERGCLDDDAGEVIGNLEVYRDLLILLSITKQQATKEGAEAGVRGREREGEGKGKGNERER